MEKPFKVHANYSLYILIFLVVYVGISLENISIVMSSAYGYFMLSIVYFIFAALITFVLRPEIVLTDDWIIYEFLLIEKKINRHNIREIKTRKSFMFGGGARYGGPLGTNSNAGSKQDTIFLDAKGEELGRLNLSSPFYNQDDIKELITRLQSKIDKQN